MSESLPLPAALGPAEDPDEPDVPALLQAASAAHADAPLGAAPAAVRAWFDAALDSAIPDADGTLATAQQTASVLARHAKADNTRRAYRAGVRAWCAWCGRDDLTPLPARPADIAAFLAAERYRPEGEKPLAANTLRLRVAAIGYLHYLAGCPSPTSTAVVTETFAGLDRLAKQEGQGPRPKLAAKIGILREILAPIGEDFPGIRDRALLLVGFAGALRRSELAGIVFADLERTDQGYELTLKRSKGAQTESVLVPLPYGRTELCPVRALARWLEAAAIAGGPVFRRIWLPPAAPDDPAGSPPPRPAIGTEPLTPRSIARIVQGRAAAAGFAGHEFGGHSLKRGALSTGMQAGAHAAQLKRLGRHKSFDVLGEYLEFGNLFEGHALRDVL